MSKLGLNVQHKDEVNQALKPLKTPAKPGKYDMQRVFFQLDSKSNLGFAVCLKTLFKDLKKGRYSEDPAKNKAGAIQLAMYSSQQQKALNSQGFVVIGQWIIGQFDKNSFACLGGKRRLIDVDAGFGYLEQALYDVLFKEVVAPDSDAVREVKAAEKAKLAEQNRLASCFNDQMCKKIFAVLQQHFPKIQISGDWLIKSAENGLSREIFEEELGCKDAAKIKFSAVEVSRVLIQKHVMANLRQFSVSTEPEREMFAKAFSTKERDAHAITEVYQVSVAGLTKEQLLEGKPEKGITPAVADLSGRDVRPSITVASKGFCSPGHLQRVAVVGGEARDMPVLSGGSSNAFLVIEHCLSNAVAIGPYLDSLREQPEAKAAQTKRGQDVASIAAAPKAGLMSNPQSKPVQSTLGALEVVPSIPTPNKMG